MLACHSLRATEATNITVRIMLEKLLEDLGRSRPRVSEILGRGVMLNTGEYAT